LSLNGPASYVSVRVLAVWHLLDVLSCFESRDAPIITMLIQMPVPHTLVCSERNGIEMTCLISTQLRKFVLVMITIT